jgi:TolB-like protein/Tfp pilus assembly protein PilF
LKAFNMTRFGTFEIDVRARELRKGGIRIRLQDQPFEILAMMLERPGEIVTRDELRRRLWPAGTFVDFEHSLNAAVKRLRAALGDTADNPRFIETLHKRGYRFIAPVESAENGARGAETPLAEMLHRRGHRFVAPFESTGNGERVAQTLFARAPARPHAEAAATLRLVVLPFANMSNDPAQEYFSDGLTEEMITQIGRLCPGRLGVLARSSSMLFKRSTKSASEIGRQLGVDYLLEGSVRREGDRVRIAAQLIEASSEVHLWAETYDRRVEESLLLQSDVAARIAGSLAMELVPERREALERVSPRQTAAYQAYLKGRFHWNRTGDEGLKPALIFYQRALDLDPDFASAHAAMARAEIALADFSREPGRAALARARAAALRAIELDPGIGEAHVAMAEVYKGLDWNWDQAEAAYRTAIALSPSCEVAHRSYAVFLAAMGRCDEARREADRAAWLDPMCLAVNTSAAWVRYAAGEFDEAIDRCRHALEMESGYSLARRLLGAAYVAAGRHREGIAELEKVSGDDCVRSVSLAWLAQAKAVSGRSDEASDLLAHLAGLHTDCYVPAYHMALAYAALGRTDAAFASLSRAFDDRDPAVVQLGVEPRFAPLRNEARFAGLLAQLSLPSGVSVAGGWKSP